MKAATRPRKPVYILWVARQPLLGCGSAGFLVCWPRQCLAMDTADSGHIFEHILTVLRLILSWFCRYFILNWLSTELERFRAEFGQIFNKFCTDYQQILNSFWTDIDQTLKRFCRDRWHILILFQPLLGCGSAGFLVCWPRQCLAMDTTDSSVRELDTLWYVTVVVSTSQSNPGMSGATR